LRGHCPGVRPDRSRQFAGHRVDAICVVPFAVEAVEPVLKKVRARGIKVISHEAASQENADLISSTC